MKAALIGLGMVAATYAKALSETRDRIELAGVFARNPQSRADFVRQWAPQAKSYGSIDEIARDPEIDFVILATPPNARREILEVLAQAGKPVLMEKPVERGLTRARELVELCEDRNIPLGIVFQHRKRPAAIQLKEMLEAGRFGDLRMAEITVPWWRPQSYYNEPGRGSYARDGGGVMISQAIHTLDLALSLTGPVKTVSAMTATSGLHQMESEDFAHAGFTFANGAIGQFFATTAAYPGRSDTIRLHFDHSAVLLEGNTLKIDWHNGTSETLGEQAATGSGADPMAFTHAWHQAVIEDFARGLTENRPPMVPGREALRVHETIDAIICSARLGQRVELAG